MEKFDEVTVYYPMAAWCVPHVTDFVEKLHLDRDKAVVQDRSAEVSAVATWTVEDLQKLRPLIRHNRVAMAMLDLASESEGKFVTFPDACERAGLELAQGRAGIGALTKVCNKIGKNGSWPVKYEWAGNGEPVACYTMSKEVAANWRKASAE